MPVELKPWAYDQIFIVDNTTTREDDRIVLGSNAATAALSIERPRDQRGHSLYGLIENARTYHRPTGLIIMNISRINDGDIKIGRCFSKLAATEIPAAPRRRSQFRGLYPHYLWESCPEFTILRATPERS